MASPSREVKENELRLTVIDSDSDADNDLFNIK